MATFSRALLSGSTNGKGILIAATSTPGTAIHTAVSGTSGIDMVYLFVTNTAAAAHTITLEWGGTGTANNISSSVSIPANTGPTILVPGIPLQNGLSIAAFADLTNVLVITGFVNRIV